MSNSLMKKIREYQLNKCRQAYEREVYWQKHVYERYISQKEGRKWVVLTDSNSWSLEQLNDYGKNHGFIVYTLGEVRFSLDAGKVFAKAVKDGGKVVYGDEDCIDGKGLRQHHFFKPEIWSPDTYDAIHYTGSFIVMSHSVNEKIPQKIREEASKNKCYESLRKITNEGIHILYTEYGTIARHIMHVDGIKGHFRGELEPLLLEYAFAKAEVERKKREAAAPTLPKVSVIIPSKDNPTVLRLCLQSMKVLTKYADYEIIVVDNGSSLSNREQIEKLQEEFGFTYLYEPMEFNFSKMCNLGAKHSTGELLLLLNDDVEILSENWMEIMAYAAAKPHAGAVGAKLLFPERKGIQHTGVTNLSAGPSHKLLTLSDEKTYYFGRNRLTYDMIGVTAACLMVGREKYFEVGGFEEGLQVSYNDVNFCFDLYEAGYYNVIRNDAVLLHHESLSRGFDGDSDEKWERLLKEKVKLYSMHPKLKGYDPFYNKQLNGYNNVYECDNYYSFECKGSARANHNVPDYIPQNWFNNCLQVTLEPIHYERRTDLIGPGDMYRIEGWAYVMGMDNSRYKYSVILGRQEDGQVRRAYVTAPRLREDVKAVMENEVNVELAGFVARIYRIDIESGNYKIGILAQDRCSRQRLFTWTKESIIVRH